MIRATISLAALLAATPALAQDRDDIIVTALGIEQPRDEVGQAVTVIDEQTIVTRQTVSVADLLATTPGVRFNRADAVGGVTGVSIRGAETTQTLVLVDGVKINDPSGIGDGYDFGNLLTGNVRRIEVLRGSNSVVYGSQAIGGVVNIMTGEPAQGFGGSASLDYGYADTLNAKADVSGSSGIASGGVGVAYFRTDGISAAVNGTEKDGYENVATNAKLKLAFSDNFSLDLRGYYIHADLDTDIFFGAPMESSDVSKLDQYIGYAGLNLSLFDGKLTNRAAVTWFRNDRDYYFMRGTAPDYGYSGTNLRFEYEGVYQPADPVKLVLGYEHERPDYAFFGFGSDASARVNIDSVYALAVVKPFAGLSLTGGVRHDDHSQFGGATTFGANANYTPNEGRTNVRASYGEGFKAPSLFQLYDSFNGNAALQPETSKSYDVGFDQSLDGGRATFSVTAFRRDIHDQIYFDGFILPFGQYINLTRTRAKGVEAAVTLRPVEALTVTAAYSYIDAKDRSEGGLNEGKLLPRRAKDVVSMSADYRWSFGLSTGATVTMVGDSFNDAANTQRLDGYALVGVRASLPITENLEVYGRIDNLFDEEYATVYGYSTYGRSAYGGVRVRF
ncbi:TonB-dependent receptor plug domain-containing protein [Sphingobium bisphenolivorans]|uniref:TonB-dependent receptor plug domain-containing protein n=1 Tax=Sphingobium bisphenolivorans TaxID=1335760 RepID=UPI00039C45BC|nr:TonB-dependent receptor [Sphingobium bisphenolivorans]